ncbi:proteasome stabiliser-domain-containing protein [Entophlyctis helioformis]|nr:proteasome stabiliser-domain-containing protein [Entophlyctis helioformis]
MASKELELLENVELRLALADTDAKFEATVATFLAPFLRKLDSPHDAVRHKVVGMCSHVNKRLKATPAIKVPVEPLLALYTAQASGPLLRSFALVYIELAFARLSDPEAVKFLPLLIPGIAGRPAAQRSVILAIAIPIMAKYKPPRPSDPPVHDPFGFAGHDADLQFVLECILDIMLYIVPASGRTLTAQTAAANAATPPPTALDVLPPGLSKAAVVTITNSLQAPWCKSNADVRDLKTALARVLMMDHVLPDRVCVLEKFLIFLVCAGNAYSEVQAVGEEGLRRYAKPDFEDAAVVVRLYALYLGNGGPATAASPAASPAASAPAASTPTPTAATPAAAAASAVSDTLRGPATPALKHKILDFLMRSARATNQLPQTVQVAFDALYSPTTTPKLRLAGMSFVQWIARMADTDKLRPIGAVMLSGLLKFINDGPPETGSALENETLHGFAYEAVGLLSKRLPSLFRDDLSILVGFFSAVSTVSRNVRVSVQEALSNMIPAYKDVIADAAKRTQIEALLLANMDKHEHHARYIATKYAVQLFPFTSTFARYICVLASADPKLEVMDEAKRGLRFPDLPPVGGSDAEERAALDGWRQLLPGFSDTVELFARLGKRSRAAAVAIYPGAKWVTNMTAAAYTHQLEFLRQLLVLTADPRARVSELGVIEDFAAGTSGIVGATTRARLSELLLAMWTAQHADTTTATATTDMQVDVAKSVTGLHGYIHFIEQALKADGGDAILQLVASSLLLELVSLAPRGLSVSYSGRADWIRSFLSSIRDETRLSMAHILGIVATSNLEDAGRLASLLKLLDELLAGSVDMARTATELRHGSMVSIGFLIGRLEYRHPYDFGTLVPVAKISTLLDAVAEGLHGDHPFIVIGACEALAEAGRYAPLVFVDGAKWTAKTVLDKLTSLAKSSREAKVQEAAIYALGHIALGTPAFLDTVLDFVLTLPSALSKNSEMHFNVGDTLCTALLGFASSHMIEFLDIADCAFPPPPQAGTGKSVPVPDAAKADAFVDKIMELMRPTSSAVARKAACIWLLCLTKYGGSTATVTARALQIHAAFSSLLGDRDEFTQEVASKGIGLVYDIGDQAVKDELVRSLVSTFTEGRKLAPQSVTGETQLFDSSAVGTAPDGTNITTYQSILSLAADMNQPDLVYKFMSLASHHAIWNSRRGASMGFGSIAAQAERELTPHLPQLIPRLYRYQFDPNPKVAENMRNIWRTLVKEPKKAVDAHFETIIKDLLVSLGDRMWRTREASCNALADLLHGRQMADIEPFLQDLWTMSFRALDDIKETVRVAAFATCKTLTNLTLRFTDPHNVSLAQGSKVLAIMVPFFLNKGLGSMAEEVRKFSLATVLKMCKTGGVLLKPHITDLVGTLLESLSSLEPQSLNYLSFHVDKYNVTQEQLDTSRLSAARNSPMMDAAEQCVAHVDAAVLDTLIPRLCGIIRKGVGLPTRAGCARFVYTLVQRLPQDFAPHADTVLKALSGAIQDRSPVVRKAFATAIGHVVRVATDAAVARLVAHLRKGYLEGDAGDEDARSVAPVTLLEMSRSAGDKMKGFHSTVLPLAYIGARDTTGSAEAAAAAAALAASGSTAAPTNTIKALWAAVWEENTAGASGAAKLWVIEILDLCETLLRESPSWPVKRQVGSSIADLAATLGPAIEPHMDRIIPLLTDTLSGRTWDGKRGRARGPGLCVRQRQSSARPRLAAHDRD